MVTNYGFNITSSDQFSVVCKLSVQIEFQLNKFKIKVNVINFCRLSEEMKAVCLKMRLQHSVSLKL